MDLTENSFLGVKHLLTARTHRFWKRLEKTANRLDGYG